MPRKSFKEKNYSSKHKHGNEKSHSKHSRKHNKCDLCFCVDIGIKNIQKWNELKNQCAYKSDAEFANYILTLVENHVGSVSNNNGKINSKINSESSENESNTLSTIENSSEYQHNQHVRHHKKDKKSSYHHQSKNHHHRKKHDSHKSEKRSSKHNVHFEVVSSPEINNECDTKNTKSECVNYTETIPIAHRFDLQKSSNSVNVSTAEETISKSPKKEIVDEKETSVEVCRIDQSERTEDDQNCTNSPCINISDIEPVPNLLIDKLDFNDINLKKIITDVNSNNENLCANLTPTTVVSKQIIETELDRYCENNQLKVSKKDRFNESINKHKSKRHLDREKSSLDIKVKHKRKIEKYSDDDKKKLKSHDVRKAPQLEFMASAMATSQIENIDVENEIDTSPDEEEQKNDRVAIRIKLCYCCNTRHIQEGCPLKNPIEIIDDSVSLSSWNEKQKLSYNVNNTRNRDEDDEVSYAFASLPSMCCLRELDEKHGPSIFAKEDIKKYTQFGPLIGKTVKEVDIPDDFDMRHIWEIYTEDRHVYINTEDTATSNWIRFLRPAETREKRTLSAVIKNGDLYLITCQQIAPGEELRYWLDDQTQTNKRKIEKTNCGGCNLIFQHALYYRTHCSIFHDARYSLTIRKYHCKVCGQAVLGKDNIVRHAAELHNGQGAYQCQFCKKFFLRLNYLEMHRSYGCAANPHRSRPLCDFCGRKFCQPQKLKVHIKRMHSDISLSEFQCPLCLKLLGSRAAVQRHAREVHRGMGLTKNTTSHGPTGSSLSCIRCGKLFQNKSNLKIHMLTHSGVKPFRCKQDNCNAAFTTKQCLQFHYKKVHGFTEDFMPTIERSVEYTFEAYSGGVTTDDDVAQISVEPVEYFNNTQAIISKKKAVSKVSELSSDVGDKFKEEKDKVINSSSVLYSPALINSEQSSGSTQTPPILESCIAQNKTQPIASKGSKKWLGSSDQQEIYSFDEDHRDETSNVILDVDEPRQENDRSKFNLCLSVYNARHDSSNASLLVEAALDSVSDIHVGTESNQNCTDSLVVSNLYPLSQHDNLTDMNYGQTELASERDINLISPSVDHVSVTDHENPNIDYNALPHDDFSTPNSPSLPNHLIHEYVTQRSSSVRPRNDYEINRSDHSPRDSPPHYDFNQTLNADTISNDSDGVVAQNLSINAKDKDRLELDFSCYKTHYDDVDSTDLSMRKYDSLRNKFDVESDDRNYDIPIDVTDDRKGYNSSSSELHKQFATDNTPNVETYSDVIDASDVKSVDNDLRTKSYDGLDSDALRSLKYDLESKYENELRTKGYESMEADDLRSKIYESNLDADLRANKLYNILDNPELRNKTYDALLETDFRTDRGFEPLILNPTELQGLDMSARSGYHGFHTGSSVSRYHHVYGEPERETVPYGPPTDVLRVVSLDLTSQTRHGLHGLHAQIPNARLLTEHSLQHNLTANRLLTDHNRLTLDQTRLISTEHNLSVALLGSEGRLLSDHTTNRILSNEQITEPRLVSPDPHRIMSETSRLSNRSFSSYAMSTSYHPPAIGSRSHIGSPSHNPSYHHYSGYY